MATKPKFLKRLLKLFGTGLLFIAIVVAIDIWRGRAMTGQPLPSGQLITMDGETINLYDRSFKEPVIVYFWATWCPICTYVTPQVDWFAEHYPLVSVAFQSGSEQRLQAYITEHQYQLPVVADETGQLARNWAINMTPAIAIVRDGKVVVFTAGFTTYPGLLARYYWVQLTHQFQ